MSVTHYFTSSELGPQAALLKYCLRGQTAMPDDNSELAPPLPIPNRAVKRLSADDSTDYPCESRTLSGTHEEKARPQ